MIDWLLGMDNLNEVSASCKPHHSCDFTFYNLFIQTQMYIGIQSFFDIAVHINALIKHVSFLTPNILFLYVFN